MVRRRAGFSYWSLSAHLKHKVKNAGESISNYENALAGEARRRNAGGVICGHIHTAEIRTNGERAYGNGGERVESCTALVEHEDGRLEILKWADLHAVPLLSALKTVQCALPSSPTSGSLGSVASSARSIP